jgi:hypothetical protein
MLRALVSAGPFFCWVVEVGGGLNLDTGRGKPEREFVESPLSSVNRAVRSKPEMRRPEKYSPALAPRASRRPLVDASICRCAAPQPCRRACAQVTDPERAGAAQLLTAHSLRHTRRKSIPNSLSQLHQ